MPDHPRTLPWDAGTWLNEPTSRVDGAGQLQVTADEGSDFWQVTSYGFRRDSGHALLYPLAQDEAIEVSFLADFTHLYDQAGALLRVDEETWIKAGIEHTDGVPQLSAVVTRGSSDWSTFPVPDWNGRLVTIRMSRTGDAVTVRGRVEAEPWVMIRLAPLDPAAVTSAGPFCAAPERSGLTVRFTGARLGPADTGLHQPPAQVDGTVFR
jgi:regulation of enolase protein 1 (concanavalin A-like superfamily)